VKGFPAFAANGLPATSIGAGADTDALKPNENF